MPLETLFTDLEAEFARDPRGPGVARLLEAYSKSEDWREYALFDTACYTRNLIHRCTDFELLLLCWDADQESPVHNHMGQNCWMAVLEGELEEVHFREPVEDVDGPLTTGNVRRCCPGNVAFITDDIALHLVRPLNSERGVSLHLYSKPIDACNVYCERTGRVELKTMEYYSIRGVRQGG
jgi:cysteine dioxygenase